VKRLKSETLAKSARSEFKIQYCPKKEKESLFSTLKKNIN
jgi:hypothetical protein